jgi:hypothetical protein
MIYFKSYFALIALFTITLVVVSAKKRVYSKSINKDKLKYNNKCSDENLIINSDIKKISKILQGMILKELQNINKNEEDESANMNRKTVQFDLLMKLNKLYNKIKCPRKEI